MTAVPIPVGIVYDWSLVCHWTACGVSDFEQHQLLCTVVRYMAGLLSPFLAIKRVPSPLITIMMYCIMILKHVILKHVYHYLPSSFVKKKASSCWWLDAWTLCPHNW